MAGFFGRITSSKWAPWALAAVLLVVLTLAATGMIDVRQLWGGGAYTDVRDRLAGADKSQPLHMRLEAQYPGPLQDTTIERWRDPVDGTVCYIYLPIAVAHEDGPSGLVQYGSASIGSISCLHDR